MVDHTQAHGSDITTCHNLLHQPGTLKRGKPASTLDDRTACALLEGNSAKPGLGILGKGFLSHQI